ncbi:alpha/beta hydrolase [Rothia terrae]|uniref:alpha/beta hydrolase n=1 Tax=Rothia terrae TaxID=396015 RepID=UPI003811BF38
MTTANWDKVFKASEKVEHEKVTFQNNYGIEIVADLYKPLNAENQLPALAVSGPFGAVKEQSSGLYAQTMAERGYLTIAFDPSFTGESSGSPRRVASPDINTEDFLAAVDYLGGRDDVNADQIGVIGICGWGGMALNAAAADPRIKATLSSTMYDMSRIAGNGYFDEQDSAEERNKQRQQLAEQRTKEYAQGSFERAGGVPEEVPSDAPEFLKGYHAYYKTPRGFHERSGNSTDGWNVTGTQAFANTRFMHYIDEIENAVLILHGDQAHSLYFGKDTYKKLGQGINPANKKLQIVEGANHTDLYDGGDSNFIPWNDIEQFFNENLSK